MAGRGVDEDGGARTRPAPAVRFLLVLVVAAVGVAALVLLGGRPLPGGADGRSIVSPSTQSQVPPATPSPSAAPGTSPSPTASAAPAETSPLAGLHLVLDPGHNAGNAEAPGEIGAPVDDGRGGTKACNTVGTSTLSGYPEHAFAWDVAERVREGLEAAGAEVTLTREADGVGPCVDERGALAGEVGADALVSIHANGSENPHASGFFAMVADPPLNEAQGEPSRALAGDLVAALTEAGFPPSSSLGAGLVAREDLGTLNHATVPAVMLELLEMRNPEEAALAESPEGRQRYADAIVAGLEAWAAGGQ